MGWRNPPVPWATLEERWSDRGPRQPFPGDGSDSPAWSRTRLPYEPPPVERHRGTVPYAELHCHSNFSFLDGASHPEELVEEAVRLGLEALAITDHDGFYGVVRTAEAARAHGLPVVFGAELTLAPDLRPQMGVVDPVGDHLVVLARDPTGYARLADAISQAQMAGEKGAPRIDLDRLVEVAGPPGHWAVLTGCRKGAVNRALVDDGPAAARRALDGLVDRFGAEHVHVELWDHGDPLDSARNDALAALAVAAGVEPVATNNVHYATPARRRLAAALAAVRARRSLDEIDGWLPPAAGAHLRSGAEQARRFARYPGVVERAAELGRACAFDLSLVAPQLPPFPCPPGHDEMSFLRLLTERGATERYGSRDAERVPGAWVQIDHELAVIEQLGFPGYFLIVWDLVEFCRRSDILCQGRGSAANSAVCYALGVTKADAVSLGLLFERFLSPERDGPPDIDIDIESDRREEVIQYVYARHGRRDAAQVCNVITYRAKSAVRDMAKALGHAPGQQDAWSKEVDRWGPVRSSVEGGTTIPAPVLELAQEVEDFPRHLGIHSGGMVICDRPVVEVCPVEWGRMEGRSVLQWDKDDCAAVGLVKFDLLGLGMLTALHLTLDLVREHQGIDVDLATLPQDPEVYEMLCRADSIGVFQVESRAQMATLPRLRPRTFYDLVVEVALIRPGPIQGGSVHPYIRRRNGQEPVTYLHPLLEPALAKTLGVPLFQEQLMQMAIDVAGFSPGDADQLRQAMGSKRSRARMERLRQRLYDGMATRGITGEVADAIYDKLAAFANFGFPESHSVSFAYLVYASSWLKRYHPAAFCAALLGAQPMGFYSPHSLVQDARRHGVVVHTPDVNASRVLATLEGPAGGVAPPGTPPAEWGAGGPEVRLGLASVRGMGQDAAERLVASRTTDGPFRSPEDLARRTALPGPVLEALATAGAFGCFGLDRRRALWAAGAVADVRDDRLEGVLTGVEAPRLPGMDDQETAMADLWATGVAPDGHPTRFVRPRLDELGVVTAAELARIEHGTRVLIGGVVTHRQRPATASGITFVNIEDETGLVNVVVSVGCWSRYRTVARTAPAMLVRGRLERGDGGVINVVAERLDPLPVAAGARSRDFR
ncbi:error-prone DNA polymerase [Actinomarinicola tropica]|uniref:Error-prone DNA polymerase n=1 Tax=Actinomarinicola tropica TaxID=2789776 RepID=A0A5Q2RGC6_9ACTN|nr:error-prone DNA polymerase [Actinomarinicola tropica]QGG94763.1 DNA polymerase III subunit alpha [Actinomarinicola tropica]